MKNHVDDQWEISIKQDRRFAVVCIDDDPFVLQMLSMQIRELLSGHNILIELITDPTTAISQLQLLMEEGYQIKLVITDYRMPQMSGYELVYALKIRYPALPCVLLSGQADNFEVKDLIRSEMIIRFINKPWTKAELKDLLRDIRFN